jgi:hypothetical protein
MIGSSQMRRMGEELNKRHGEKVVVVGCVRIEEMNMDQLCEVRTIKEHVDAVIIGGPTKSLMEHGKERERGFGGEREVTVKESKTGEEVWFGP